ncbi:MAG: tetratricopeptide repeat protein [Planctomycetota bacterium]
MASSSETNRSAVLAIVLGVVATALSIVAIVRPGADDPREAQSVAEEELGAIKDPASSTGSDEQMQASDESSQSSEGESTEQKLAAPTIRLIAEPIPAQKDELEAEATFVAEQLLTLLPNEPMAKHVNAMLFAQLHQTEKAEKLWRECVNDAGDVEFFYVNLAAIEMDRGDHDAAIKTLETAVSRGLKSTDISHHLGMALTNGGRADDAIPVLETALKVQPNAASLTLILGQAQLKMGKTEEAEANLRKAVSLGAKTKSGYFALFNACMRNGKREDAKKFQAAYSRFTEKDLDPQERYQILSESEARQIAISVMSEAAVMYEAAGGLWDAEQLWLRVLALDPKALNALEELARIYAGQERFENERVVRARAVEIDATNLLGYLKLAKSEISCENPEAAESAIKLAISLAPQMVTGYAAMTDFLLEQNQPEKAVWYVQHAVKLKPSKQGFLLLARTLRAAGNESEAQVAEAQAAKL